MRYQKITIVNERNEVVGAEQLPAAIEQGLIRRIVRIIIFKNNQKEIYLQQRSPSLLLFPSYWDNSAVGHVDRGETNEEAAAREVKEELGITVALQPLMTYYREEHEPLKGRLLKGFETLFIGTYQGKITPNVKEVTVGQWFTLDQTFHLEKLTPGCKYSLEIWKEKAGKQFIDMFT